MQSTIMRSISFIFSWAYVFILLFWAIHLKDPHLMVLRKYEVALLLALCAVGFFIFLRRHSGLLRTILVSLNVAVLMITGATELSYHFEKKMVLNRNLDIERELSKHFIIGYDKVEELRTIVSKGIVGGVFVTQCNAERKTEEQLRQEIAEMQKLRQKTGLGKLIIATDQEGGIVSRLSPPLPRHSSLSTLVAKFHNKADLLAQAEKFGRQQGAELAHLGVMVNFSPVVDLKTGTADTKFDLHSLIHQRAISSSPEQTAAVALAYAKGLESQGVLPTLKHFPGLGDVQTDTHHFSAALNTPLEKLASRDWLPFQQVAQQTGALIMLGHVILPQIDKENPVSFSHAVVQQIIRGRWKNEGLLITDNLTMAAAYNYGLCEATVKALNAGVDLVLISYDYEKFYEAMNCAVAAYKNGKLKKDQLARSTKRFDQIIPFFD